MKDKLIVVVAMVCALVVVTGCHEDRYVPSYGHEEVEKSYMVGRWTVERCEAHVDYHSGGVAELLRTFYSPSEMENEVEKLVMKKEAGMVYDFMANDTCVRWYGDVARDTSRYEMSVDAVVFSKDDFVGFYAPRLLIAKENSTDSVLCCYLEKSDILKLAEETGELPSMAVNLLPSAIDKAECELHFRRMK